jgi:hypothetical protein
MRLWLDQYVKGSSVSYRALLARFPEALAGIEPEALRRALTDDAFAFRLSVETAQDVVSHAMSGGDVLGCIPPAAIEIPMWRQSLAPFFLETDRTPLAAAFDREIVGELVGLRLSPEVREYAREAVRRHGTVYLDIANHALLFGDALQLCAFFIAEAEGGIRFWAVFGEPGRHGVRRVAWIEGDDHLWTDPYSDPDVRNFQAGAGAPTLRPLVEIARDAGVDLHEVLKGLESFAYLAITYVLTEMELAEGQPWQELPHLPADDPRRHGRKARAVAKKFSLFRVWQVTGRRLDRGERQHTGGGWKLGHRITVAGHYRLQPYGSGRKLRRLRWIAQHGRGPRDGLPPRPIVRAGTFRRAARR